MLGKPTLFNKRDETPPPSLRDPRQAATPSSTGNTAAGTATPAGGGSTSINGAVNGTSAGLAAVPPKPSSPQSASRLVVGPEVKLKGAEILDCDTLIVEGRVEATMDSRVIEIAEQGAFSGKVGIDIAEIRGSFDGELQARDRLIIHATGKVSGKIRYGRILIEEGGEVSGDVRSLADDDKDRVPVLSAIIDTQKPKVLATLS